MKLQEEFESGSEKHATQLDPSSVSWVILPHSKVAFLSRGPRGGIGPRDDDEIAPQSNNPGWDY